MEYCVAVSDCFRIPKTYRSHVCACIYWTERTRKAATQLLMAVHTHKQPDTRTAFQSLYYTCCIRGVLMCELVWLVFVCVVCVCSTTQKSKVISLACVLHSIICSAATHSSTMRMVECAMLFAFRNFDGSGIDFVSHFSIN